jgi:hypothetical protein
MVVLGLLVMSFQPPDVTYSAHKPSLSRRSEAFSSSSNSAFEGEATRAEQKPQRSAHPALAVLP